MKIKVDKLKSVAGVRSELEYSLEKEEAVKSMDLDIADAPIVFHGTMENLERIIKITGTVQCTLKGICDRCGEDTTYRVETSFSEAFTNLPDKVCEGEGDESETHLFEGDEIDLLPYLERSIYLAMPMKILCKEKCKGLCPQCGQNRNNKECSCDNRPIDPRLAVLGDLLKEV